MKQIMLALCLAFGAAGCVGSGKMVEQQQAELLMLKSRSAAQGAEAKEKGAQLAALQSQKSALDEKAKDLAGKLAAAQAQIESLRQSNNELSSSIASSKDGMAKQIKTIVAEKDALAKKLNETRAARSGMQARLATLQQLSEDLQSQLDASSAEAAKKQEQSQALLAQARDDMGKLADAVLQEIEAEQARVEQKGAAIEVTLLEPLLFEPQQAKLTDSGIAVLDKIGNALRALSNRQVRVEGHSDNSRIKWELFGHFTSHWDLSAARATAVARYLHEHSGLDPRQLMASGFGEFRPLKGNDTKEGRAANRRVVIALDPTPTP